MTESVQKKKQTSKLNRQDTINCRFETHKISRHEVLNIFSRQEILQKAMRLYLCAAHPIFSAYVIIKIELSVNYILFLAFPSSLVVQAYTAFLCTKWK